MSLEMVFTGFCFGIGFAVAEVLVEAVAKLIRR